MTREKDLVQYNKDDAEQLQRGLQLTPPVDIYENEAEVLLLTDLPGVELDDLAINFESDTLSIAGTRKGAIAGDEENGGADVIYRRVFNVPQGIDAAKIGAELKNGVLHLHLPKAEGVKPREISVKAG